MLAAIFKIMHGALVPQDDFTVYKAHGVLYTLDPCRRQKIDFCARAKRPVCLN